MIKQFTPINRFRDAWAVFKTIRKGNLGPGAVCLELEEEIKKLTGAKYCYSTTSGTTALIMAIEALDLRKGSTILAPSYTFLAAHNAARFMGYKVRLVDINSYTLCMNIDRIKLTEDVSCIIFVNHNGYVGQDLLDIKKLCESKNISLIEDSCQGLGIPKSGRTGNVGVFSFSVPKLITGGQGGAVITDNEQIAKRLRQIRDHGDNWRKNRYHEFIGVNFRYTDIQASYVLSQLKDIKELLFKRWQIFAWYNKNGIRPYRFAPFSPTNESLWMVIYFSRHAYSIIKELEKNGIQAVQYYRPISVNPPYIEKDEEFLVAEDVAKKAIYLPSSLGLKKRDIKKICKIIIETETRLDPS